MIPYDSMCEYFVPTWVYDYGRRPPGKLTELFGDTVFGVEKAEGVEGVEGVEGGKGVTEGRDGQWPRMASSGGHIGHEMHALLHSDLRNKVKGQAKRTDLVYISIMTR